jgi:NOL1/NOP2/fmu family ribosome biogenesis protein
VKWGNSNVVVTNNDPKDFSAFTDFFDLILVDAPCSGEGMFRKDNAAAKEWSVANVKLCAERQQRILADVWNALKPDGLLIYCTCTYNTDENEENVKWLIDNFDAQSLKVNTQADWMISESLIPEVFSYRFYPHKTKGEGFCLSALRKNGNKNTFREKKENSVFKNLPKNLDFVRTYLLDSEKYNFVVDNDVVKAVNKDIANETSIISNRLRCLHSGILLGTIKGKDFVPSHSLALSINLNAQTFPKVNLDKTSALKFLHKDNVDFCSKNIGYNLVCHNNNALGWIKNIGSRANNLYPHEWRILMNIQ